jgi:hypothetical protein
MCGPLKGRSEETIEIDSRLSHCGPVLFLDNRRVISIIRQGTISQIVFNFFKDSL